jgi:hypothetical protein
MIFLLACGCAGKSKRKAEIQRAYASGAMTAQAQMQQARQAQMMQQSTPQALPSTEPQVRILGSVRNPVLSWSEDLTLARALVLSDYEKSTAPSLITIFRNNQPLQIDPQRVLQGEDYPLFPGDIVYIQD